MPQPNPITSPLRFGFRPLLVLMLLNLPACVSPGVRIEAITNPVPLTEVAAPDRNYSDVAWLSDDHLVVVSRPLDNENQGYDLGSINLSSVDGLAIEPFDTGIEPCGLKFVGSPVRIADGMLAFMRSCPKQSQWYKNLFLWQGKGKSAVLLYDFELPGDAVLYTFDPDMTQGIFSTQTGIADQLFWLDSDGYSQIDLAMDRAMAPAWSPDGSRIVFLGALDLPGSAGPDWAARPNTLWSIPASCAETLDGCKNDATALVSDLHNTLKVKWDPTGTWLVFDGAVSSYGAGIWLFNPASQELFQIAVGIYVKPEWSPDGQKVVVLAPSVATEADGYGSELWRLMVLDVGDIINQTTTP